MSTTYPSIPSYMTTMGQQPANQEHDSMSHEGNLLEEDGDDVFSNPDTAELESSRSDATGTTSPAPNSPGPSSPINRAGNHIAIASQHTDPFGTLKQTEYSNSQPKQGINSLTLANLPSPNTPQLTEQFGERLNVETPKAISTSPSTIQMMRPQYGRTLSASGAGTQSTLVSSGTASRGITPRIGGHAPSHSASHLNLASIHGHQPLPSAHDMPSDPREASELSKLFARPPAQSPSDELSSFGLGASPEQNIMLRSGTTGPSTPTAAASSPITSRLRSRPATRPSSPDRFSSPPRGGVLAGLGLGAVPKSNNVNVNTSETSIFERDIEHRDAGHVLSKQEAIDVAIPSVLDDAVEALTLEDCDQVEIVSPHAASPMLALSAQALSVHSHSQGRFQSPHISSASSPAHSPSPPLSSSGVAEAPPGTMAAQIAERLAMKSTGPEEVVSVLPTSTSRHRRPQSDVSVSSSSSMRSRSPQAPLPVGVQQVLDASNNPTPAASRSLSVSPTAVVTQSRRTSLATTPLSGSNPHTIFTLPSPAVAGSPIQTTTLPTATALPSLPFPNPFRTYSPPTSTVPLADKGMSMTSSVSMDGAVMTTSDSATMDASLGSLADVMASIQIDSRQVNASNIINLPYNTTKSSTIEEDVGPYSSRSPKSVSPILSPDQSIPGSFSFGSTSDDLSINSSPLRTNKSSSSSVTTKKRLSFFSYADIINKTPADLLDLDTALRQADDTFTSSSTMN